MVSADEVSRSLRGAAAFLTRRPEGMQDFGVGERAFWRSFAAITLTAPAYVVALELARHRLGLAGSPLFGDAGLAVAVLAAHLASLLALPLAAIAAGRALGIGSRIVPFVIVTNWVQALGSYGLALPGALLLAGWETPGLATLFAAAFSIVVLHQQWFATRVTLAVGPGGAAALIAGAWLLWQTPACLLHALG